jgi:hypothetical protein
MKASHPEIESTITSTGVLDDETNAKMKAAVEQFKKTHFSTGVAAKA